MSITSENGHTTLEDILKPYELTKEHYFTMIDRMEAAFRRGLCQREDCYRYSPIQMLSTYLTVLPDGSEYGRFFAIDLGGTNMRFLEIHVTGRTITPSSFSYPIPKSVMTGDAETLFDYLAQCIEEGLQKMGVLDENIQFMGFTFSFPCNQMALNSGTLIRWTKGFITSGVEGNDVVKLLKKACRKRNLHVNDFILINDTTGTLLCGAFEDSESKIGIINGTGTNACYMEVVKKVEKWKVDIPDKTVIINTEWGAFGESGELHEFVTSVDSIIDLNSINPGKQVFEKMISGMYLGEIVRCVIVEATDAGVIFHGKAPDKIYVTDTFPTRLISESYDQKLFIKSFKEIYDVELDEETYNLISKICHTVSVRSAGLCAAGLTTLMKRIDAPKCVIAADGSMFRRHPKFVSLVEEKLRMLYSDKHFKIILVDDGSGKGAALAACVASRDLCKRVGSPMIRQDS